MMTSNRPSIEQETATSGHSRRLRATLKASRERQRLTAAEVCQRIGEILDEQARSLGAEAPEAVPHVNTLYMWEAFKRHPSIAHMAAWARALGYRLVVDLADASEPRFPIVLEHQESAEIARHADAMTPGKRRALLEWVRASEE